mgnify:CR=1 FL=1
MLPVPFIVVYIRRFLQWMRRRIPVLNALADKIEKKAHLKGQKVTKYKYLGLMLFVAIPLPGTPKGIPPRSSTTGVIETSMVKQNSPAAVVRGAIRGSI